MIEKACPRKEHIKNIHKQLKSVFKTEQQEVDSMCIITSANHSSLPNEQLDYILSIKYLFQSNLDIDICCFFTFAETDLPNDQNVLTMNEITINKSLFANLSAVFQTTGASFNAIWKSNFQCFRDFLNHLDTCHPKTLRSSLEAEVPATEKREKLKSKVAVLQPEVTKGLGQLVENKTYVDTISKRKKDISSMGDISFTIEEIRQTQEQLKPGQHVTNCVQCFFTCHENCSIPDNEKKIDCAAMKDGYCTKCTGHCIWSAHKNMPYVFHYSCVEVTKSYKEMKTSYEKEKGKTLEFHEYLENLNKDIEDLLARLHDKVKRITECNNELQGLQHSPLAGSVSDTINEMVNAEKLKKEIGYEKRIEMFRELEKFSNFIRVRRN